MVASKDPEIEQPGPDDVYRVGVAGVIARMLKMPDGTLRILVQSGAARAHRRLHRHRALPRRAHPRGARRRRAVLGAGGAHAAHPDHLLEHHRGRSLPARGAADRDRERRRPRGARPHDRRLAADQGRGEAGAARGARRHQAAAPPVGDPRARARGDGARLEDPVRGPVRDGQDPARVLPARAAEGDPAGAGRGGRDPGRDQRAARADRGGRPARGRAQAGRARAVTTREAAAGGSRVRRDPHLPRVDRLAALEQVDRGQPRHRPRAQDRSTPTTTTSRRSRSGSSTTSRCAS